MKSLRTDDILGAKPSVRHMPINLLRERKTPTSFLTNMTPEFPTNNQANPEYDNYAEQNMNNNSRYFHPHVYDKPYQKPCPTNFPMPISKVKK